MCQNAILVEVPRCAQSGATATDNISQCAKTFEVAEIVDITEDIQDPENLRSKFAVLHCVTIPYALHLYMTSFTDLNLQMLSAILDVLKVSDSYHQD